MIDIKAVDPKETYDTILRIADFLRGEIEGAKFSIDNILEDLWNTLYRDPIANIDPRTMGLSEKAYAELETSIANMSHLPFRFSSIDYAKFNADMFSLMSFSDEICYLCCVSYETIAEVRQFLMDRNLINPHTEDSYTRWLSQNTIAK